MQKLYWLGIFLGIISCKSIDNKKKITDMAFTPKINQITDHLQKIQVFDGRSPLDISRKGYETMVLQLSGKKEAVAQIEEFTIPQDDHQIPVRLYNPKGKNTAGSPAIIYIHGGWFISGGYETHDAVVRKLANATGAVVLFPDYRLAPEHPFPAGLDDCRAAVKWFIENAQSLGIDSSKIGVMGDSAGGALAAVVSSELGNQLKFQALIYPAADNTFSTKSWETYKEGPVLNKEGGIQAWNWYLPSENDRHNPSAVPILIKDFKNTPPTLIVLAEHDPLRDEGEKLAENMKKSGVSVKTSVYKDMVHGFMHMGGVLTETQAAVDETAVFILENLEK
ncbi:acetyl esterase [Chryseobacterium sp. H1D6B]|uniref:alpha/beta hydrolase n=1 Tax=Chryseobacterium sp. H1D6B TaxID=2940588 RepID=UPI0017A6D3F9|nr:alpha/beta hydrolase [Chryseobacterium sp. H1D6B]MDH6253802.1 acetyl esterase [Chryseobacterium sp. H1D6B]